LKGTWDDERDPLSALRRGDPGLYEEFVRTETRSFVAFFLRSGARLHEAEDLVQELFLKLYNHAPNYEARERFPAYAYRIARNSWIDHQRRRSSRPGLLSIDQPSVGGDGGAGAASGRSLPSPEQPVSERLSQLEQADRMRAALRELPEHHRLVFELGVLQELPYAEIGRSLGIPVGTVKSRMFHAVRKLRHALGDAPPGEPGGNGEEGP